MTAVLLGMLFCAGAAWLWQQMSAVNLPTPTWAVVLRPTSDNPLPTVGPGTAVDFQVAGAAAGSFEKIGSGVVDKIDAGSGQTQVLTVRDLSGFAAGASPNDASTLAVATQSFRIETRTGIPIFQLTYLQAGAAGLMILLGFITIYLYVGRKPAPVEFLIATDGEMRKVNWSTWREIRGSTWVVVFATFMLAAVILVIDLSFQTFFSAIGIFKAS